ncbi:MAG: hypothetical protein WAU91_16525, partial [Desulfatitalea sp.]
HNRPAAAQQGNRPAVTEGLPRAIQQQGADRDHQNRPSLPGQPANSMSPRSRERVFQPRTEQQPAQSEPERPAQKVFERREQRSDERQGQPSSERPSRGEPQNSGRGNIFKEMRR